MDAELKALFYELGREIAKGVRDELHKHPPQNTCLGSDTVGMVSDLFNLYRVHKVSAGRWKEDTESRAIDSFSLFLDIVGDMPCNALSRQHGRMYRDSLLRVPANRHKKPKYRNLTTRQLLKQKIPKTHLLKKRSVNLILKWVSGCFDWGIREGIIGQNPVKGLEVSENDSVPYRAFNDGEITKLYSHHLFTDPDCPRRELKTYKFWTPLLGMFTGARLGELCQLRVSDVKKTRSGVWYLSIKDEEADQRVKTKNSIRKTPISQTLIDLGFLEYFSLVKASGNDMLFPDLKKGPRGWQQYPSSQFARMLDQAGLGDRKGLCFHSFRKNAVDQLAVHTRKDSVVSAVVGHSQRGMTFSRYFSEYPLEELKAVIDMIDYSYDWSALGGKWKRCVL